MVLLPLLASAFLCGCLALANVDPTPELTFRDGHRQRPPTDTVEVVPLGTLPADLVAFADARVEGAISEDGATEKIRRLAQSVGADVVEVRRNTAGDDAPVTGGAASRNGFGVGLGFSPETRIMEAVFFFRPAADSTADGDSRP